MNLTSTQWSRVYSTARQMQDYDAYIGRVLFHLQHLPEIEDGSLDAALRLAAVGLFVPPRVDFQDGGQHRGKINLSLGARRRLKQKLASRPRLQRPVPA